MRIRLLFRIIFRFRVIYIQIQNDQNDAESRTQNEPEIYNYIQNEVQNYIQNYIQIQNEPDIQNLDLE